MASTGAQDRAARQARHAQRRTALREQREQQNRPVRTSITTTTDPFELVATGQPAEQPLPF